MKIAAIILGLLVAIGVVIGYFLAKSEDDGRKGSL